MDADTLIEALEVFRLIAPEFSSVDDDTVEAWIGMMSPLVSKKQFGKLYAHALALLVAHKLKVNDINNQSDSSSSPVAGITFGDALRLSSVSEGETSVSLGNGLATSSLSGDEEYGLTIYGLQYLTLRKSVIVPIHIG